MTTELIGANKATGIVTIQAVDAHSFELAATGLSGNWLLYVVAGLLAMMSVGGYVAYRRREHNEEE